MSLPQPQPERFREVYKLSKLSLGPQQVNGGGETLPQKQSQQQQQLKGPPKTSAKSLETFLQELRATLPESRRPFVINLNGDGAMLIAIPRPLSEVQVVQKAFYYLITDPWLDGTADFLGQPMFISLGHIETEAYRSIAAVELLIRAIENAVPGQSEPQSSSYGNDLPTRPGIDAIIVSNALADHAHPPTLLTADPKTPLFAASDAVGTIKLWDHFEHMWTIPNLQIGGKSPLPKWLNVVRLPAESEALEVTHGILITWTANQASRPEGILYAPHGVAVETVERVLVGSRIIRLLAILHPVNQTLTEGAADSLGVHTGLLVYRATDAKYWVQTHDPDLERGGILAEFQEFQELSLEDALAVNPGPRPNFWPRVNGGIYPLV